MGDTSSLDPKFKDDTAQQKSSKPAILAQLKKRLHEIRAKWGPLMAAKEDWSDEYNFPPGRHAGHRHQGTIPNPMLGFY
jgi:hypothetical protein